MRLWFISTMTMLAVAGVASAEPRADAASARTRNLSGFYTVAASGHFSVDVAVGPEYEVRVEGADAHRVRTRVDSGALKIEPLNRPWFGNPRYDVRIHVTLPQLEGVVAARGAILRAEAGGACASFSAIAAMGADVRVSGLQCEAVEAAAAMGAHLSLAGSCRNLGASAAMGADVRAADLRCETVEARAAMGAEVAAFASATYAASAAMGGDITVAGGARFGDRSTAMGGSITQRD